MKGSKYCKKDVVSCKSMCKKRGYIVETTVLKCFEKLLFLNFKGSMHRGGHSYPAVQLAVWKVTENRLHCRCFPAIFFKLVATPILPVGQLRSAAC